MPPTCHPNLGRVTTLVLVGVAVLSGGIVLLGDGFGVTPSYALTPAARLSPRIAACVAEENMRLIDPDRERCDPGEIQLGPRGPALSCPRGR